MAKSRLKSNRQDTGPARISDKHSESGKPCSYSSLKNIEEKGLRPLPMPPIKKDKKNK